MYVSIVKLIYRTGIISGQYKGNDDDAGREILELHAENNWVKYHENLEAEQMKKLRQLKNGNYEVYITEKCNHYFKRHLCPTSQIT